ncbi:MAG: RNA methyltransferase [Proteobacteria bacterium]|nr:RNA methyltransferase [Pseudomonadota bacterium]
MALVHYPVVNKSGNVIASAVTNLDLHDMARAAKTYGVKQLYVVTPLADQKELAQEIISHWTSGAGSTFNPKRRQALELITIKDSIEDVLQEIFSVEKSYPKTVVTSAKDSSGCTSFAEFHELLEEANPYLLIFGTGWGLAEEIIVQSDYLLEPIKGNTDYNHLSVRSACSIILDRLIRG